MLKTCGLFQNSCSVDEYWTVKKGCWRQKKIHLMLSFLWGTAYGCSLEILQLKLFTCLEDFFNALQRLFFFHCTRLNWMFWNWGCDVKKYAGLECIYTWEPVATIECKIQTRQLLGPQTIWEISLYFQSLSHSFTSLLAQAGDKTPSLAQDWRQTTETALWTTQVSVTYICYVFSPINIWRRNCICYLCLPSVLEINTVMLTMKRDKS